MVTERREGMFWTIAFVLLILWLAGLLTHIGGPLVHILVIIALVMIIYRLVRGKRIP
jgi:hypothetical protein